MIQGNADGILFGLYGKEGFGRGEQRNANPLDTPAIVDRVGERIYGACQILHLPEYFKGGYSCHTKDSLVRNQRLSRPNSGSTFVVFLNVSGRAGAEGRRSGMRGTSTATVCDRASEGLSLGLFIPV